MFDCVPLAGDARNVDHRVDDFLAAWRGVSAESMGDFADSVAAWLDLGAAPRLAVDAFAALGIISKRQSLPAGVWAVWSVEGEEYVVRYSQFLSAERANFTLWHELFDIFASRPAFRQRVSPGALERLSDVFAAHITMPEAAVRAACHALSGSGDKTDVMAARFAVSPSAMRRRLRELRLLRLFHIAR